MNRLPLLLLLATSPLLPACSGGEKPRAAEFVPPAPAETDFGTLRVRYTALPTLSLSEAIAKQYGVPRDAGTALVVIALRTTAGGEEAGIDGEVAVSARDLSGARQSVSLRQIDAGGYMDHIGTVRVSPHNSYRFEATVTVEGRTEKVEFQRNF